MSYDQGFPEVFEEGPASVESDATPRTEPIQSESSAQRTEPIQSESSAPRLSADPAFVSDVTCTTAALDVYTLLPETLAFEDLAELCTTYEVGEKDGPAIIPALFKPCPEGACLRGKKTCLGDHRLGHNVTAMTALGIDIDGVSLAEMDQITDGLEARGFAFIAWTTHSHNPPDDCRLRLLLPFAEPMPISSRGQWSRVAWPALVSHLGLPLDPDSTCRNPDRIYYLPRKPSEDAVRLAGFRHGVLLDWRPVVGESMHAMQSAPGVAEPVAEDLTRLVDLEGIKERLASIRVGAQPGGIAWMLRRVLKGKPPTLPPGPERDAAKLPSRYDAWRSVTAVVANVAEGWESRDALYEAILKPSYVAQAAEAEWQYDDETITGLLEKAMANAPAWRAERAAERQEAMKRALARVRAARAAAKQPALVAVADAAPSVLPTEPPSAPEVELVKLVSQGRWFARRADAFDIETPYTMTAAEEYLVALGYAVDRAALKKIIPLSEPPSPGAPFKWIFGLVCAPSEPEFITATDGLTVLNTWVPPTLALAPGEWPRIREILLWLVNNDERGLAWVLNWCAFKLQHPASLPGSAILLQGAPGSGKNVMYRVLAECLGPKNCVTIGESDLAARFNSHFAAKLLVFANELIDNHERHASLNDGLKAYVTDKAGWLEAKGITRISIENRLAVIAATNNRKPIELDADDRRWSVFCNWTNPRGTDHEQLLRSSHVPGATDTFTPEFLGEVSAFGHDMLQAKINYASVRTPYENSARQELQRLSEPAPAQFIRELSEATNKVEWLSGFGLGRSGIFTGSSTVEPVVPRTGYASQGLYETFRGFCDKNGIHYVSAQRQFASALSHHGWVPFKDDKRRGWSPPWTISRGSVP